MKQSRLSPRGGYTLECFAEPVIRPRLARTGWLAMTGKTRTPLTGRGVFYSDLISGVGGAPPGGWRINLS
jgi:hypothetical protein